MNTQTTFLGESSSLDAHIRLLFRAYHYETPCRAESYKAIMYLSSGTTFLPSFFLYPTATFQHVK